MMNRKRKAETEKNKKAWIISKSAFDAVIFDLDGVVTKTARVHAAAWKELFDEYLKQHADREDETFKPFDTAVDYPLYVDGKSRYDGVRDFLLSRGIEVPYGTPSDAPAIETICGLGNRKNRLFLKRLRSEGAEAYTTTISLIKNLRSLGFQTAIISASENCIDVLEAAGVTKLFDTRVDGVDSIELGLNGKPASDIFIEAARRLDVPPERAVVVEDAIAGVEAGRRGGFGCVIGVDRTGHAEALIKGGADVVVKDLSGIGVSENGADARNEDK